jgi:hypothetical protein
LTKLDLLSALLLIENGLQCLTVKQTVAAQCA